MLPSACTTAFSLAEPYHAHTHVVAEGLANLLWHENAYLGSQWAPYRASRRPSVQPRTGFTGYSNIPELFMCQAFHFLGGVSKMENWDRPKNHRNLPPKHLIFLMASGKSLDDYI